MQKFPCKVLATVQAFFLAFTPQLAYASLPFETRTIDGSNNNATNTDWGSTGIHLIRNISVQYEDDISEPRGGNSAVSARVISNAVAAQSTDIRSARGLSDLFWTWGQFIDHDIDLTEGHDPHEAFPIAVPAGDPQFDPFNTGTAQIPLNRSIYDPTTGTDASNPRQQLNLITAFLDASNVYGSDQTRAFALRTFTDGLLKTSNGDLLPFNTPGLPNAMSNSPIFFLAGDVRANEQPGLTALHTLFVREHNRLAVEIKATNPSLTDEEIYQTARRTVGALMQVITYNEFLPALFGSDILPAYSGYQSSVDPSVANEFSTAAYRLGHSMISPTLLRLGADGTEIAEGHVALLSGFFNPGILQQAGIDPLLRGLAAQVMQEVDSKEIDALRNFLFGPPGAGGFDLVSLNIQRGRDHGLASYNQARRDLGLPARTSFSEITSDAALASQFEAVYQGDIEDVDLWIAGLAEDHVPGSSVGETFTAILKDQFQRLRDGDRFWYEAEFSGAELTALDSTTLADVIERNTSITGLQQNVFFAQFPQADLETTVSIEDIVLEGTPLSPEVRVKNNGPLAAANVEVSIPVPTNTTFSTADSDAECTENTGTVTCSTASLDSGSTFMPTVVFTPDVAACFSTVSFTATASADQHDEDTANNAATDSVFYACPGPNDVDLEVRVSSSVSAQRTSSFTTMVSATNNGPASVDEATLTIDIPSGLQVNSVSNPACSVGADITCTFTDLAALASVDIEVEYTIPGSVSCPAVATVNASVSSGAQTDYFAGNNSASSETAIECEPENDMAVTLTGASEVPLGNPISFEATITNNGPAIAATPKTTFALPSGVTFSTGSSSSECSLNGAQIECTDAPLAIGSSFTYEIFFTPLPALACGTEVSLQATVSSSETETNSSNNTSSTQKTELTCSAPSGGNESSSPNGPTVIPIAENFRDRDTVGRSNSPGATRGKGTSEAKVALALLCRRNGMRNEIAYGGHFRMVAGSEKLTPIGIVGSDRTVIRDGFTQAERNIVCGMKRYMNEQDPRKRKTPEFRNWLISEIAKDLKKSIELIESAVQDDTFCETVV